MEYRLKYRITTGLSEAVNNQIKRLKRQAMGCKDLAYFALKIMQKCGYLNYKYLLSHHSELSTWQQIKERNLRLSISSPVTVSVPPPAAGLELGETVTIALGEPTAP